MADSKKKKDTEQTSHLALKSTKAVSSRSSSRSSGAGSSRSAGTGTASRASSTGASSSRSKGTAAKSSGAATSARSSATKASSGARRSGTAAKDTVTSRKKVEPQEQVLAAEELEEQRIEAEAASNLHDEIMVIISLLFNGLLVLSYLGLCGRFGQWVNLAIFGSVGVFGYVFPLVLFVLSVFCISNKHNRSAFGKAVYCVLLIMFVTAVVQIAVGGYDPELELSDYFTNSIPGFTGDSRTYGGILGGLICYLLVPYVGELAAVCILCALILIMFMLIAGRALFTSITKRSIEHMQEEKKRKLEADAREAEEIAREYEELGLDPDDDFFSVDKPVRKKKDSFIDSLMRKGMGLEVNRIADTPEYQSMTAIPEPDLDIPGEDRSNAPDSAEQGAASTADGASADTSTAATGSEPSQNAPDGQKSASMDRDIVASELDRKFGDRKDKQVPSFIEKKRINEVPNTRTFMVDEEPEAASKPEPEHKTEQKSWTSNLDTEHSTTNVTPIAANVNPRHLTSEEIDRIFEKIPTPDPVKPVDRSDAFTVGERELGFDSDDDHDDTDTQPEADEPEIIRAVPKTYAAPQDRTRVQGGVKARDVRPVSGRESMPAREPASASGNDRTTAPDRGQTPADRTSSGAVCFTDMSKAKPTENKILPYIYPPIDLLNKPTGPAKNVAQSELDSTVAKLQSTFESFGVGVKVTDATCGPTVTRYELTPDQGVKVKTITSLADDIKLALAAAEIRIEAPIPGKAAVGIEVPNSVTSPVLLRELLESPSFTDAQSNLTFAVGKDIGGKTICFDIGSMPHMLIAGATGSGKSVCINALIMSILYKAKPSDVRLIMIDPKRVELIGYNGIPHLLVPVVTDVKKATGALSWAIAEMDDRYSRFADAGVNNLKSYNRLMEEKYFEAGNEGECPDRLPQIVIIVDELNDLMMTANGKEVEAAICRLTQLARASGIHVVLATQRPSVNVITGTIKANIPSRIAFSVSSIVDSRTILDQAGAEKLLGKGDMLFYPQGYPKPVRLQGAYVSDREVAAVVDFIKSTTKEIKYNELLSKHLDSHGAGADKQQSGFGSTQEEDLDERDEFYEAAGRFIIEKQKASIGMLQRMYKIGFNRAARIMDSLADDGVVGPEEGTKPRRILMTIKQFEAFLNNGDAGADDGGAEAGYSDEEYTDEPQNEDVGYEPADAGYGSDGSGYDYEDDLPEGRGDRL